MATSTDPHVPHYPKTRLLEREARTMVTSLRPKRGARPRCFASSAVYSCDDHECAYRADCEQAVSPWFSYP